jgi:hypothetical protein
MFSLGETFGQEVVLILEQFLTINLNQKYI